MKTDQKLTAALRNAGFYNPKSHQVVWSSEFYVIHSSHQTRAAQSRGPLAHSRIRFREVGHANKISKTIFGIS